MLKQILTARVHPKVEYFLSLFTVPLTGFDLRHLVQKQSRPYCYSSLVYTHTHTSILALFPGLPGWAGTRKEKTNLDFNETTDSEWQWHQLGLCTSLQTDNHASTPPLSFLQAGYPSRCPTNSVKALKANALVYTRQYFMMQNWRCNWLAEEHWEHCFVRLFRKVGKEEDVMWRLFRNDCRSGWSCWMLYHRRRTCCNTHTRLTALFPGLPGWAGTRKVKPIWILLEQETVSGSDISWAICKSAPRSRQITMPVPHHSSFLQAGCPSCRPTNSVKALYQYKQ